MPLIKNGSVIEDPYARLGREDPIPARGGFVVDLARWAAERDDLRALAAARPVGVAAPNDADIEILGYDVDVIRAIVLTFPKFTNGRAYSQARLLRDRLGFRGELRAAGDVLRDQLLFMRRAGFDSFQVDDDRAVDGWRRALEEISVYYQPASDKSEHALALRHRRHTVDARSRRA